MILGTSIEFQVFHFRRRIFTETMDQVFLAFKIGLFSCSFSHMFFFSKSLICFLSSSSSLFLTHSFVVQMENAIGFPKSIAGIIDCAGNHTDGIDKQFCFEIHINIFETHYQKQIFIQNCSLICICLTICFVALYNIHQLQCKERLNKTETPLHQ